MDPERSWFAEPEYGERPTGSGRPDERGRPVQDRAEHYDPAADYDTDSGLRLPDQRPGEPGQPLADPGRRGMDRPPDGRHGASRGAPHRPRHPVDEPPGVVYRARRAGVAGLLVVITVVAELFLVRVLLTGEFGSRVDAGTTLAGLFGMTGLPLVAVGLYALVTGAALAAGPAPVRAWLRAPLAYLPVGLILLIAAGLAAR